MKDGKDLVKGTSHIKGLAKLRFGQNLVPKFKLSYFQKSVFATKYEGIILI